jgi:hypothetical protein
MSNSLPSNTFNDGLIISLPGFHDQPAISLDFTAIKTAERRLIDSKTVNTATYNELEHVFGEAYRELKKHITTVGFQIMKTEAILKRNKAVAILDKYPEYIKAKEGLSDNAKVRDAFVDTDKDVIEAQERLDSLKATEMFLDGRIKVMENVCRYMRKQMDLLMRSGIR